MTESDNARFVRLTGATPEEAAKIFFGACSSNDWTETAKYMNLSSEFLKKYPSFFNTFTNTFGGLEILSLGKPFKGRVIMFGGKAYAGVMFHTRYVE